ncbi:FKBP-type peptidyl-prolyl cis-trans isomerase [Demequina pelophila]|uniref:FKBP-type peptidyl-prolyl cis-trans isomerase n=1 Tax=Demequina pelophila TaxID=1638984 RepID=UPI0007836271|nr:FKBP-type peptidyl-prolyl cis-trans isomerase [Demequina pelophila]
MRRLVTPALALAALVALPALTACSATAPDADASASPAATIDDIVITNSDTLAPALELPAGAEFAAEAAKVVWDGDGQRLQEGQPLLLDIYGESLTGGTPVINTYDGLPRSFLMTEDMVGEAMYAALHDLRVGARVLVVAPHSDESGEDSIAMVVDVLPVTTTGTELEPDPGLPTVTRDATGEPSIDLGERTDAPADLTVATLIEGRGPQVREDSYLTVNYTAVYWADGSDGEAEWSRGDVFESSWPLEKAPFQFQLGQGRVIRGWEEGLLDQTAGSQVLMVVPTSYGYATKGTLVFVVDILDVWNPEV